MSDASPHGPAILGVLELATYFVFGTKMLQGSGSVISVLFKK
jgi:hypothetical protein